MTMTEPDEPKREPPPDDWDRWEQWQERRRS